MLVSVDSSLQHFPRPFCSPLYLSPLYVLHPLCQTNPTPPSGPDLGSPSPGNLPHPLASSRSSSLGPSPLPVHSSIKALLQLVYLGPSRPLSPGNCGLLPGKPESYWHLCSPSAWPLVDHSVKVC